MFFSKKKICLRLKGGVGNQLFCYSYARSLAEKTGRKLVLDTVTGFLNDDFGRNSRVTSFLSSYTECSVFEKALSFFVRRFPNLAKPLVNAVYWKEPDPRCFKPIELKQMEDTSLLFLEGYFQSYRYFEDNFHLIKSEIEINIETSPIIKNLYYDIINCNSVAIHVRRVAYDNLLELEYYKKAIDLMLEKVDLAHWFIFSDDIEWCKENFSFLGACNFINHDSDDEIVDLWLMTQCKSHIIANSSFSWWGAWLATSADKTIIGPKRSTIGVKDMLFPKDWILV